MTDNELFNYLTEEEKHNIAVRIFEKQLTESIERVESNPYINKYQLYLNKAIDMYIEKHPKTEDTINQALDISLGKFIKRNSSNDSEEPLDETITHGIKNRIDEIMTERSGDIDKAVEQRLAMAIDKLIDENVTIKITDILLSKKDSIIRDILSNLEESDE